METEKKQKKPHAIMISLPSQGHITPFVNLALKLSSKGFAITFVHNESVHHTLSKSHNYNDINEVNFFSEARKSGLDIRYTTISDGFPVEFDRFLHREEYMKSILRDFPTRVDDFVANIIGSDPYSTSFLVTDTLYSWPAAIAKKYNLVNVSFWTEPALVFSLDYHFDLLQENGHFPCKDDTEEEIKYIPGIESINTRDLMPYLKEAEMFTITPKIVINSFQAVKKADFILHNTIHELESTTLSALQKKQPNYAIGPINFPQNLAKSNRITTSLWPQSDCTKWLDSKPPGSVLYVSFGSLVRVSKSVIQEIAHGILLSEVNFIWVVGTGTVDVLPNGIFEDKVKDKWLIVPWCDQIQVLSNPSVGGFLTHCGWNSVLESIWCRVPMICYPLSFDQPTNRKLLVDVWRIGIDLGDGVSLNRVDVAENVRRLMSETASVGLRRELRKMNDILRSALENGGSSDRNFDQFVDDLKAKIHEIEL